MTGLSEKVADFSQVAKDEQLQPPEMVQKSKAVRYADGWVKVKNTTESNFDAHSFAKRAEYKITSGYYDATLPDAAELGLTVLGLAQLVIITKEIPAGKTGLGHIGQKAQKVEIADGEEMEIGDPVGSKAGSGKAMIGGPYIAVATEVEDEKNFVWVIPNE